MNKYKKGLCMWSVIVLLFGLLAGCSSANGDSANSKGEMSEQTGSSEAGSSAAGDMISSDNEPVEEPAADGDATEPTSGGGFASGTAAGAEGFNQKIIYTASLSMQVDELASAATSLRNAIHQSGGYILQFQDTRHEGEVGASYTIKVPADGFMSFIDRIEQIKHRDFERNIGGKDVSEEYVDLESRLKAKQLVETRLLAMMDKAVRADDLLKFSQQLSEVQEEIERIKGRIRYLDNNVSYSTVELRLYQTDQALKNTSLKNPHLGGRMSDALAASTKVVWEAFNLVLVVLAGAVPVAAVLAVIAIPAVWLSRRKKKGKALKRVESSDEEQPPIL